MQLDNASSTRLNGSLLWVARLAWVALVALTLGLYVVAVFEDLRESPPPFADIVDPMMLSAEDVEVLRGLGLPEILASWPVDVPFLLLGLVYFAVAGVIFWRRSSDWVALLVSFMLVFVGVFLMGSTEDAITRHHAAWIPIKDAAMLAGIVALVLVLFVFPNGRFVPRWTRFVPFAAGAGFLPLTLPLPEAVSEIAGTVTALGMLATGVYARIYRYRHVSTPVQRQQTKWIAFGMVGVFALIIIWFVAFLAFPVDQPRPGRIYFLLIVAPTFVVIGFVLPMSVAIAMLRHRLWDVDIILNRTMVYGPMTGILLGLYIASIRLFQTLFVQFTGQESDISILLSTLVLAGAFMPLRLRLDALVQRYFKEGSDPASGLSTFAAQIRSVADLSDRGLMTRRLLDETVAAFHAENGAVFLAQGGELRLAQTAGSWNDGAVNDVSMEYQGAQIGRLSLGQRHRSKEYSPQDREALQDIANVTARALALASGHPR